MTTRDADYYLAEAQDAWQSARLAAPASEKMLAFAELAGQALAISKELRKLERP